MKYIPLIHVGTPEQIIDGLISEAESILHSGFMRMHAQCRELDRIQKELKELGVDMLDGFDEDEGKTLFVKDHLPNCDPAKDCYCPPFRTIEGSI